jgi:hypothetical protein
MMMGLAFSLAQALHQEKQLEKPFTIQELEPPS